MKGQEIVPLTVKLLGREYQVSCPSDERDHLLASARYLDDRMQAIRKRAAGLGVERIAVMTALNMAREMLQYEQSGAPRKPAGTPVDVSAARKPDLRVVSGEETDRAHQMQLRIEAELGSD